jgi:hypothetical protein
VRSDTGEWWWLSILTRPIFFKAAKTSVADLLMPFGINYQLMAILTKRSYRFVSIAGRCQVAVVRKHFEKHCNPTLLQKRYLNEDSSSLPDLQETKKQKTVTEIYSTIPSK